MLDSVEERGQGLTIKTFSVMIDIHFILYAKENGKPLKVLSREAG